MPQNINRHQVQELIERGGLLVEVLPPSPYQAVHIAGAINIPLAKIDRKSVAGFNRNEPLIVYCHDYQ
jgi:rhodanese-related sulfurtransferase